MGQRSSWCHFMLTKPKSLVMYPHVTDKPMGERVTSRDLQPCLRGHAAVRLTQRQHMQALVLGAWPWQRPEGPCGAGQDSSA